MQLPVPVRLTKTCDRCGLHYPKRHPACVHCAELSNQEVIELQERYDAKQARGARLGQSFLVGAAVVLVVTFALFLAGT